MSEIQSVGPFAIGKTLGSGTTGKVKLGHHKETGVKVAIKIISKDFLTTRISMLKKVEREIAVMKVLDHPNVLKLYDVYETSKYLFLVLEYIEGGELFDYLIKRGRLHPNEALIYFQQLIAGLDYLHAHRICHRDLKPENLLLDSERRIKIGDFGMASLIKSGSLLHTSCGSPHYASPEVVMGHRYDGMAADVWSCGVILFALLTGKLPFDDENIRKLLSKVKAGVFTMPAYVPSDIAQLISSMLTVDPAARIKLADVKRHSWLAGAVLSLPLLPPPVPVDELGPSAVAAESIDEDITRSLHALGLGTMAELRVELTSTLSTSIAQVFYRLLHDRKRRLALPFAPAADVAPPPEPLVPVTAVPSSPLPVGIAALRRHDSNLAASPPASPAQPSPFAAAASFGTSPAGYSGFAAHHAFASSPAGAGGYSATASGIDGNESAAALLMAGLAGESHKRHRPAAQHQQQQQPPPLMAASPTPPMSINNAAKRFQQMKLSQQPPSMPAALAAESAPIAVPGTSPSAQLLVGSAPIVGSSPKRSWFSTFFANSKADKEQQQSGSSSKATAVAEEEFTVLSRLSEEQLCDELERSFRQLRVAFEPSEQWDNSISYRASYASSRAAGNVKFSVDLLELEADDDGQAGYKVSFHLRSGPTDDYNELVSSLKSNLKL
eukprot:TRINITY_DN8435_c0_g1_i2.p1 TRINITY_DN8435_c0_g1~~TRINITY_DN8435_c0_g1_i2.p1  ORF type:complete len:667 (-),score=226.68 TRINITY_DN8435_c0_g1_i2:240-2240(-)